MTYDASVFDKLANEYLTNVNMNLNLLATSYLILDVLRINTYEFYVCIWKMFITDVDVRTYGIRTSHIL